MIGSATGHDLKRQRKYFSMVIRLTNTILIAIIDDKHFERVSKHSWYLKRVDDYSSYVASSFREDGKNKTLYLHRFILNAGKGMDVHHKNRDPLDNRECNLEEKEGRLHRIWHCQQRR